MGTGLTKEEELKVENSRQITNVALVLLPAVAVVVSFVLDNRIVGAAFWWLSVLAAAMIAGSILAGGLGISRVRQGHSKGFSLFNLQAVLCLAGFVLLLSSYLAVGEPTQTDLEQRVDSLNRQVGAADERFKIATAQAGLTTAELRSLREEVVALKQQVDELRSRQTRRPSPTPAAKR
jgi:hypothetical protein